MSIDLTELLAGFTDDWRVDERHALVCVPTQHRVVERRVHVLMLRVQPIVTSRCTHEQSANEHAGHVGVTLNTRAVEGDPEGPESREKPTASGKFELLLGEACTIRGEGLGRGSASGCVCLLLSLSRHTTIVRYL